MKNFPINLFIKNFIVFADLSSLGDVSFLDTPGYNSTSEIDKSRMFEAINFAHVIFYLMDIHDGAITRDVIENVLINTQG